MARLLVLYYSSWGHVESMAYAAAEGVRTIQGCEAEVKRVPETVPRPVAEKAGYKLEQSAPVATVAELANYDGLLLGVPTRYGRLCGQMANFLDQTGSLWANNALVGKVGSVFGSTASQHGGQETNLFSAITNMLHLGLVIVGLPYTFTGQTRLDEVTGGSPYGATTIAGGKGERLPSANELDAVRFQGAHVARITARLAG